MTMTEFRKAGERISTDETANDVSEHTLLPMLIAGLVLIVIGSVVVMAFV